jgi:hypothetical protein
MHKLSALLAAGRTGKMLQINLACSRCNASAERVSRGHHRRNVVSKPSAARRGTYAVCIVAIVVVMAGALLSFSAAHRRGPGAGSSPSFSSAGNSVPQLQSQTIQAKFAALPLAFEENEGQTDPQVKYTARANGYTLFLTDRGAVFAFHSKSAGEPDGHRRVSDRIKSGSKTQKGSSAVVRMKLVNDNAEAQPEAADLLPGKTNYYLGSDPAKWHKGVSRFGRVSYKGVYPGVDLAYYGQQSKLEFDFIVAPHSDPGPIGLAFSGAKCVGTDDAGNLVIATGAGDVVLHKPVAYQLQDGVRQPIDARFERNARNQVGFHVGSYDRSRELVIDPSIVYATYLGGSNEDEAYGIAVDATGAYITGATDSPNFPNSIVAGPFLDAFVTKLDPNGALLYSTLIGGSAGNGVSLGLGIAVNSTGTYVIGNTTSTNFPATVLILPGGLQDVFVAKLDNTGAQKWLTRLGGSSNDSGNAIAVDSTGAAYIGGETDSTDFPIAGPGIQGTSAGNGDGFYAKLDPTGGFLDYGDYIGGSLGDLVTGIAVDGTNNAYVTGITVSSNFPITSGSFQTTQAGTGDNAFVAAVKADGSALIYSTYLGGSGTTDAYGIAVDSTGEAYVTGDTDSTAFPTVNPAQASLKGATDAFITKLNASGTGLFFSTYFGGTQGEIATGIALDSLNDVYVTGETDSSDYPTSGSPFQTTLGGGTDAFVTELSNTGFTVYSSYLGGTGNENSVNVGADIIPALGAVAVDASSNAYLAGATQAGFPVTASPLQSNFAGGIADAFVAKIGAAPADFSVSVSPATISVASGQTTTAITVTVSSVNSPFGSAVTLSCGAKPTNAACNFSPLSVTPTGTAATSSLTISTNGSTGNGMLSPPTSRHAFFYAMLMPLGGLGMLIAGSRSSKKKLLASIALFCMLAMLMVLPACGGSSSKGGGGGGGGTNTPTGTYSLTVSGASGSVTHTVPLSLTVQ